MNFAFWWPIGALVLANLTYHFCFKLIPASVNLFASLTVTYLFSSVAALALCWYTSPSGEFLGQYTKINWIAFILGFCLIGLEAGAYYMYKAGWQINIAAMVYSTIVSIILMISGSLFFHETFTLTKVFGAILCFVDLFFVMR